MANDPISGLPQAIALTGDEFSPVVQAGVTKRARVSQFDLTGQLPGSVQDANTVFAGPTSGSPDYPSFRDLVPADIPNGLPSGGSTGQQLVKISATNYDVGWVDDPAVPEPANTVLAGPTSGPNADPTFRALVNGDLPTVDVSHGGSGRTSATAYAVLCGGTTTTAAHQSVASVGTIGQALLSNGAGNLPTFQTLSSAVGAALTRVDDTNVTLTLGGAPTTALLSATSITAGWTGQLAVGRGGTGLSAGTSGGIPYFNSTSTMASSAALTATAIVKGGGAGAAPVASGVTIDASNNVASFANLTQTAPGGEWTNVGSGVSIARLDRTLGGAATTNSGDIPTSVKDWLETLRASTTTNSQLAVLSRVGLIAVLGGSRTSDFSTAGTEGCIGVTGWGINNNASQLQTAYAIYGEAQRSVGAGTTHGMEIDIVNYGSEVTVTPYGTYDYLTGLTSGIWLASGGGHTPNDASVGLYFVNNTSRFKKGIVYGATALEGTDGTGTGAGIAMEMARGHFIQWLEADGDTGASISSDVSNSGPTQKILFSDLGTLFRNSADKTLLRIDAASTYVNGVSIFPKATASNPIIQATGDDTNVGLVLQAQATEFIRFANSAVPNSSDGAALGTTSLQWSDAFLASGGVLNWSNGNYTVTHSSGLLTFSNQVTITNSASFFNALLLESTNDDANAGPYMLFRRTSATPANNDVGGTFIWQFRNGSNAQFNGATIDAVMTDVTASSEDVTLRVTTSLNGANNNLCASFGGGMYVGSSSDLGAGTLNVQNEVRVGGTLRITQAASSIGTGAKTISNAADSSTNFGKYFSINLNGTTVFIPCGTVAPT